jgi:sugar phosphate isomerase/epimerase
MERRDFLISGLLGAPALVASVSPLSLINYEPAQKPVPGLKLSFQDGIAPGRTPEERFDFMEEYGIEGFEPRGYDIINNAGRFQKLLKYRNIKISAVQSGYKGFVFSADPAVRIEYRSIIKEIIAAAGELGSTGVIIVPGTNLMAAESINKSDFCKFAVDQLHELAEHAARYNTTIILKPVNRKEAACLNTVEEVAEICRSVNMNGLRCMGDFWHMAAEEISDMDAIVSGGKYLNHIHIASRKTRYLPGTDGTADNYTEGFKGLKKIKYQGYISFDCGIRGKKNILVPESIRFLCCQWQSS